MKTILNRIDRLLLAITFAESNEPELAKAFLESGETSRKNRQQTQTTHMSGGQAAAQQAAH